MWEALFGAGEVANFSRCFFPADSPCRTSCQRPGQPLPISPSVNWGHYFDAFWGVYQSQKIVVDGKISVAFCSPCQKKQFNFLWFNTEHPLVGKRFKVRTSLGKMNQRTLLSLPEWMAPKNVRTVCLPPKWSNPPPPKKKKKERKEIGPGTQEVTWTFPLPRSGPRAHPAAPQGASRRRRGWRRRWRPPAAPQPPATSGSGWRGGGGAVVGGADRGGGGGGGRRIIRGGRVGGGESWRGWRTQT